MSFQNEQENFVEGWLSQFKGTQEAVMRGLENLGNTAIAVGESALNGMLAIVGLGGLGSNSSPSGSAINSGRSGDNAPSSPAIPNIPTIPESPVISQGASIKIAMDQTINRLPESVRELVDRERNILGKYADNKMQDVSENSLAIAGQSPATGLTQTVRGMS